MKRIDITFPEENQEKVREILEKYGEDSPVFFEVARNGKDCLRCELVKDSAEIDELIEEIRGITDIESGDLLIEALEQTTHVEKGKRQRGGSEDLSVYEMYSKAFDFSHFNISSWALIALSSIIAVIGLAINNVIVVIGAMVIAPMLGPFISSSFGIVVGDTKISRESLLNGIGGVGLAVGVALLIGLMFEIRFNPLMRMIAEPGVGTIPLALAVGSASALAFSSEARETLAGIAVAIALVPPSAVAGLTLASLNLEMFFNVSLVILANLMSLILAGSITFLLIGVKPRTRYKEEISKKKLRKALTVTVSSIIIISAAVGYLTYSEYQQTSAVNQIETVLDESYNAEILSQEINTNSEIEVNLIVVNPDISEEELERVLEASVDREIVVDVTEVSTKD